MERFFEDDEELGWRSDLFAPRTSTLYTLLRKTKELVVVQSGGEVLLTNSLVIES